MPITVKIDKLIRSRRRTIGLTITSDARLVVRAPHSTPAHEIERLISKKQRWINQKQEFFRKRPLHTPKQFIEGEEFLFLGESYPLHITQNLPKAVVLDSALMISQAVLKNAADHIRHWYEQQALEYISQRAAYYAELAGLAYRSVKVNNAKGRWGSCGHKDTLNFTWRLIMAPPRVIDYVVVHELMHLKQKNHSRKFWDEVKIIISDYQQDEQWLKDHSHHLRF